MWLLLIGFCQRDTTVMELLLSCLYRQSVISMFSSVLLKVSSQPVCEKSAVLSLDLNKRSRYSQSHKSKQSVGQNQF